MPKINITRPENPLEATLTIPVPFHITPHYYKCLTGAVAGGHMTGDECDAVFAYGMLLWIILDGIERMPDEYIDCENAEEVVNLLEVGLLPTISANVKDQHVGVLHYCWEVINNRSITLDGVKQLLK